MIIIIIANKRRTSHFTTTKYYYYYYYYSGKFGILDMGTCGYGYPLLLGWLFRERWIDWIEEDGWMHGWMDGLCWWWNAVIVTTDFLSGCMRLVIAC
ncbi:uncharacterized protein J3D65DRAFT_610590 [Phyllosticta citribraziliensis]|uniref:Uncharacterized protein n=1 Tax=Phyllosticta citribraziliensis TaxID=989973 RepID=A0ABR1MA50_9PEZI